MQMEGGRQKDYGIRIRAALQLPRLFCGCLWSLAGWRHGLSRSYRLEVSVPFCVRYASSSRWLVRLFPTEILLLCLGGCASTHTVPHG